MTTLMTPLPGPAPTHRCTTCGALWRYWPRRDTGFDEDSWNLRTKHGGPCCSGASEPMRGQIVPLTLDDLRTAIEAAEKAEPVAWMMVNPTTLPGHRSLHWKPQTDWHITWESVPLYAAPQTPQPARNPWRDAMDDELVCLHLGTTETFPEPREALRQIIDWHVEIALDPAVSSRAAELQSRGPAQKAEQAQAVWAPIDTAPPGQTVLVYYKNCADNGRTMRATYYSPETLESDTSDSGWADEGWYEESEAYEYLMPLQGEPTHWMPLPPPPGSAPQPARKPMTEEEIDAATAAERDALLDHIYEHGTIAEGVQRRIRALARAIERHHGIGGEHE